MLKPRTVVIVAAAGTAAFVFWRWQRRRLIQFDQALFTNTEETRTLLSPGNTGAPPSEKKKSRPIPTKIHKGEPPKMPLTSDSSFTVGNKKAWSTNQVDQPAAESEPDAPEPAAMPETPEATALESSQDEDAADFEEQSEETGSSENHHQTLRNRIRARTSS